MENKKSIVEYHDTGKDKGIYIVRTGLAAGVIADLFIKEGIPIGFMDEIFEQTKKEIERYPVTSIRPSQERTKGINFLAKYSKLTVETDEKIPRVVAEITDDDVNPAEGYCVRLSPLYD